MLSILPIFHVTRSKGAELNINQKLRERDAMNTDAIATFSDKLALVMQEIELLKKQK